MQFGAYGGGTGQLKVKCALTCSLLLLYLASGCGSPSDVVRHSPYSDEVRRALYVEQPVVERQLRYGEYQQVEQSFVIKNVSATPIDVVIGPSTCGCTEVVVPSDRRVEAGGELELRLRLHVEQQVGVITGSVPFAPRGTQEWQYLTFRGVVPGVKARDGTDVFLGRSGAASGRMPPLVLEVFDTADAPLDIESVQTNSEWLVCQSPMVIAADNPTIGKLVLVPLEVSEAPVHSQSCIIDVSYRAGESMHMVSVPYKYVAPSASGS
jgi:hypothetical protein